MTEARALFRGIAQSLRRPTLMLLHDFRPPPYGGGNQFMLAFEKEVERVGIRCSRNHVVRSTQACLFNSMNFDAKYLYRVKREYPKIRMIHRVDGPKAAYRGFDDGSDRVVWEYNRDLADASVFQSHYSLQEYLRMGFEFRSPVVISNAVDPSIFHLEGRNPPPDNLRKIKLIATAWSDNALKGADIHQWIDEHLDGMRYEFCFVGSTQAVLPRTRKISPVPSMQLAELLRQHDIYVAASINDPCSNALLEALACGMPAVYRKSGGHSELVKDGGLGFQGTDDVMEAINSLVKDYPRYQNAIHVARMATVATEYLRLLSLR